MSNSKKDELSFRFGLRDLDEASEPEGDQGIEEEGPSRPAAAKKKPSAMDEVSRTLGRTIVSVLQNLGGKANVFAILDQLPSFRIEELLPAASWLEQNGFVKVQSPRPRTGDWTLELTERAKDLL